MSAREILIGLSVKYKNEWEKIYKAILNKEYPNDEEIEKAIATIDDERVITILDQEYPEKFKHIYKPPFVIYA